MLDVPQPLIHFLAATVIQNRFLAYLQTTKEGKLLTAGGAWNRYHFNPLTRYQPVSDQLWFLAGLLPAPEAAIHIPFLQLEENIIAEVHIFAEPEQDWVILLDATAENAKQVLIQQKVNDLSLLRRKQAHMLDQLLQANPGAVHSLDPPPAGEHKFLTILLLKYVDHSSLVEGGTVVDPLKQLDTDLSTLSPLIVDEGGILHQSIGSAIVAIFGVLPTTRHSSLQAVAASIRILEVLQDHYRFSTADTLCPWGLVLTSGRLIIRLQPGGVGKSLAVLGQPLDLAMNLYNHIQAGTLIIDKPTFNQLDQMQRYFIPMIGMDQLTMPSPLFYSYTPS
jgi:class 3 adenylate cyclase